jgi:cytochrome P450
MSGHRADGYFDDITRVLHTALEVAIIKRLPKIFARDPRFLRARARLEQLSDLLLASAPEDESPRSANILVVLGRAIRDGVLSAKDAPLITLTPYLAGLDTVATSLAFFVYATYRDPAIHARLREEAHMAFLGAEPGAGWLGRLPFTEACRLESMRRYPVTIGSIRRAKTSFVFAGHRIDAGEDALFAISAQLFMPEHYPDPFCFDPARFLRGAPAPAPGTCTPFGVGAHTCLGAGLAEAQLTATRATLRRDDAIELVRPPHEVRVRYAPLPEPVGLRVRITRRGVA